MVRLTAEASFTVVNDRSLLYTAYTDECNRQHMQPAMFAANTSYTEAS